MLLPGISRLLAVARDITWWRAHSRLERQKAAELPRGVWSRWHVDL